MAKKPTPPNPSGVCQCGCGRKTPLAKCNQPARQIVRGEHTRFIHGHAGRRLPPDNRYRKPPYIPTAEEIAAGCELAQSKWTETQRNGRIVDERLRAHPVQPLVVQISPWLASELNVLRVGRRGI